jgi:putative PEP-CTERM system histidine kinase
MMDANVKLAAASYASACVAYATLAGSFARHRSRSTVGSLLITPVLASAVWAAVVSAQRLQPAIPLSVVFGVEIVRDGAWVVFLLRLLGGATGDSPARWTRMAGRMAIAVTLAAATGVGLAPQFAVSPSAQTLAFVATALGFALSGFILIGQAYRNTRANAMWAAKLLWLAIGGIFVIDSWLYATALMYGSIPMPMWETRGAALALLVPVLAAGLSRLSEYPTGRFLSGKLMFVSSGVIAAGAVLLAVASIGYYLRVIGGTWGAFAQLLLLFMAALLLIVLAFSGHARAWLRVKVAKHIRPYRHDYRVEWLRLVRVMDAADGDRSLAERAIAAVSQLIHADGGGLWVLQEAVYVPVGGDLAGPDSPTEPADGAFARALADRAWIVDLRPPVDTAPPRQPVPVPAWLAAISRARYVVPLLQERKLVGFLVIVQPLVAHQLDWEDIDLLRTAGRQVASYIALEQAARLLAQAHQFEAFNRFVAFIMHDLKNLIAQQRLVVQNAARHRGDPQFVDDAISTIENSAQRMTRLLEQLRHGESTPGARRVNVAQLCTEVVARCGMREPRPSLELLDSSVEVLVSPERLSDVLQSVVSNAQEATIAGGWVRIAVSRAPRGAIIEVADNGRGMDSVFVRDRLFRPFDSTKGSQGMGIGAYQAREFVRSVGGDVRVHSEPGKGTRFMIELPAIGGWN